jgi:probable HAF family extracellular repeat protein
MAVSADGSVVVGLSASDLGTEAFRWTATGGMVGLGDLPGGVYQSWGFGVSDDGAVVVGTSLSESGNEAFRWDRSTGMVALGDLPDGDFDSRARDASADGSVIVGCGSSALATNEAFRWTALEGMIGLGGLPGGDGSSYAHAVSADGSVIVGRGGGSLGWQAFVWDEVRGMRVLQDVLEEDFGVELSGWVLSEARDVSADGTTVAGIGRNPAGETEAWVAWIPEPAALPLLMCGGLLAAGMRRRVRTAGR